MPRSGAAPPYQILDPGRSFDYDSVLEEMFHVEHFLEPLETAEEKPALVKTRLELPRLANHRRTPARLFHVEHLD